MGELVKPRTDHFHAETRVHQPDEIPFSFGASRDPVNPAGSTPTSPTPLTHAGRAVVAGLEALVAPPLGAALMAAVGVDADRAVEGAHKGEAGTLVFIWGDEGEGRKDTDSV